MRERPILFSGPMVRALLREVDPKTQTRRVIKPAIEDRDGAWYWSHPRYSNGGGANYFHTKTISDSLIEAMLPCCPYGVAGDRLWVREAWAHDGPDLETVRARHEDMLPGGESYGPYYLATEEAPDTLRWRPSIHMPRWASRITLEVVKVRIEQLQDISEADAKAEGCSADDEIENALIDPGTGRANMTWTERAGSAAESYCNLWQRINRRPAGEPTSWEENPWVWVVEFKRVQAC